MMATCDMRFNYLHWSVFGMAAMWLAAQGVRAVVVAAAATLLRSSVAAEALQLRFRRARCWGASVVAYRDNLQDKDIELWVTRYIGDSGTPTVEDLAYWSSSGYVWYAAAEVPVGATINYRIAARPAVYPLGRELLSSRILRPSSRVYC